MQRFNKASERPVSRELAESIERVRDLLFREFGVDYAFSILGEGHVLACSMQNTIIHAVTKDYTDV